MEELEEQSPPPRPKRRWRHWLLPVVFTVLLYAGLGLAFYDKKQPTQPLPAESNEQATAVAVVSDDVPPIQEFEVGGSVVVPEELPAERVVSVQQPSSSVNLTPVATTPQATRKIYHNQPAPPPKIPEVVEPLPVEENLPPSPPKSEPSPESQALTKAEEEAEAQNELLREAINKVKELNDGKIAKARESVEESPSVVAKIEKVEVAESGKEESQASNDVENE